jgi:hypothetical protein
MIHKVASLATILTVISLACDVPISFTETGTGNGSSRDFHLTAGSHRITYQANDREPFFGCNFGISLDSPSPDPLAPGRMITKTDILRIDPKGRISGALVTPHIVEGQYSIHYLGDVPCDWTITIF